MVISRHQTGRIKTLRNIAFSILLPLYLSIPWFRMDGHPIIRLDIPGRKFYLLGNVFLPQEGIFLLLFLLTAGFSLFFFTSLIGRVWCGWACPQTVFTELFDTIGRIVVGDKYGKKDAPLYKKLGLHAVWIAVSLAGSLAWIAYFADPLVMIEQIRTASLFENENTWPYFTAFFTFTLYGDMAFVREQFCKYACPYARFQTVLMDDHSMNVTYDYVRGEPRRKGKEKIGDCISCNMCVLVCPTGIDIRDGVQVGCIACGKCVDACTHIMAKENKESLVRYLAQNQVENPTVKIKWIRPRTILYAAILTLILSSASILLIKRVPVYVSIIPDRNILPMQIPDGKVRNFYTVKLQNMSLHDQSLHPSIDTSDLKTPVNLLVGEENGSILLPAGSTKDIRLIVQTEKLLPDDKFTRNHSIQIRFKDKNTAKISKSKKVPFTLPEASVK